jgi:hypothetical protein
MKSTQTKGSNDMETPTYTPEQQAENRAKLVAALRSGDYAQGQSVLRTVESRKQRFCCLGVACDISGLGVWDDDIAGYKAADGSYSRTHLPDAVKRWLGFRTDNGALEASITTPRQNEVRVLTDANDDDVSFAEIADLIEGGKVQIV